MGIREKLNPKKLSSDEYLVPTPSFKENYQAKRKDSVEKEDEDKEYDEDVEEMVLSEYCSNLKDMELSEFGGAAKVMNDSIFSAAFHPCTSRLLMAAGDNSGEVGLWIPDSDMGDNDVLLFEPHTKPVVCMAFSRSHPTDLLTLSCDGTLRSTNVKKAVFDEVYRIKHSLKTFDFLSHDCSTLVAGDWNGDVAIIDRRTPGTSHESLHSLDSNMVCCVHVHPVHKQYIVVALNRIYDTSEITHKAPLLTRIKHGMETQPWMSDLAAVWDPKKEDCFVGGQHTAASQNAGVP